MKTEKNITGSTQPFSQLIVKLCRVYEVNHIIISPGSRNVPLLYGFVGDSFFRCYSIVDERSAAFFALGIAQQRQKPVAIVCTSGSALLNYYPAIAEAYYSDIPLLIISADRPQHKIDIGDGQTIRQVGVFSNHILHETNLLNTFKIKENTKKIKIALETCIHQRGPVHINVPFEEPLYEITEQIEIVEKTIKIKSSLPSLCVSDLEWFKTKWHSASKRMILIGQFPKKNMRVEFLEKIIKNEIAVIFTETLSNLKSKIAFLPIDKILNAVEGNSDLQKHLQPDLLLTFGGMIVSKKIKKFLRAYPPKYHIHVDTKKAYNTFFCLTHHFKASPNKLLNEIDRMPSVFKENNYSLFWNRFKAQIEDKHKKFLSKVEYSDLYVYDCIFRTWPKNIQLQLANSSVIRYAQLFENLYSIPNYCNRGTSGIDGSTSTAIGASLVGNSPTIFITGDLSFFYDSNALWNEYIRKDFRIILINNGGGGIFRILKGGKMSSLDSTFLETKHNLSAQHLSVFYGFEYLSYNHKENLTEILKKFYKKGTRPKILEIYTPREVNDKVLEAYFEYIK